MCAPFSEIVTWWTWDPLAFGAVGSASAAYGLGRRRLAARGQAHAVRGWAVASFFAGQVLLLLALVSPIDRLSDLLFSAHMTQHEVLLVIAPPLVVLGKPLVAYLALLSPRARAFVTAALRRRPGALLARVATSPLAMLVVHSAVVWAWHVPSLFLAAMRSEAIHAVQHASFFLTAALFWWGILRGRHGRAGYGLAVAFVFVTAVHTSVLGALITVARHVWYPVYVGRTAVLDLGALEDQELAGLVMWVPGGVLLTLAALALLLAWLGEAGRRVARAERRRDSLASSSLTPKGQHP